MMKKFIFSAFIFLSFYANAERDFMTRISEIQCKNEKNIIDLKWDSAVTPLGPVVVDINGTNYANGLKMTFHDGLTTYETVNGIIISLDSKDDQKSKFLKKIKVKGVEEDFNCTYKTSLKFFRERQRQDPVKKTIR